MLTSEQHQGQDEEVLQGITSRGDHQGRIFKMRDSSVISQ